MIKQGFTICGQTQRFDWLDVIRHQSVAVVFVQSEHIQYRLLHVQHVQVRIELVQLSLQINCHIGAQAARPQLLLLLLSEMWFDDVTTNGRAKGHVLVLVSRLAQLKVNERLAQELVLDFLHHLELILLRIELGLVPVMSYKFEADFYL